VYFTRNVGKELYVSAKFAKGFYRCRKSDFSLVNYDIVIFLKSIRNILCGNGAIELLIRACRIFENNFDIFEFFRNILCIFAFNIYLMLF